MRGVFMKLKSIIIATITCIAMVGLVGCGTNYNNSSKTNDSTTATQEWVIGNVSEIAGNEMVIESTSDSSGSLTGTVRVNIESIDSAIRNNVSQGKSVKVYYSGQVGMSEPPFISAKSLDVLY